MKVNDDLISAQLDCSSYPPELPSAHYIIKPQKLVKMQNAKKGAHRLTSERHFSSCTVIRSLDRGATGDWHEDTAVTAWDGSGGAEGLNAGKESPPVIMPGCQHLTWAYQLMRAARCALLPASDD